MIVQPPPSDLRTPGAPPRRPTTASWTTWQPVLGPDLTVSRGDLSRPSLLSPDDPAAEPGGAPGVAGGTRRRASRTAASSTPSRSATPSRWRPGCGRADSTSRPITANAGRTPRGAGGCLARQPGEGAGRDHRARHGLRQARPGLRHPLSDARLGRRLLPAGGPRRPRPFDAAYGVLLSGDEESDDHRLLHREAPFPSREEVAQVLDAWRTHPRGSRSRRDGPGQSQQRDGSRRRSRSCRWNRRRPIASRRASGRSRPRS